MRGTKCGHGNSDLVSGVCGGVGVQGEGLHAHVLLQALVCICICKITSTGEIAGLLKRYAEGFHIPVVVTNQITTAFGVCGGHCVCTADSILTAHSTTTTTAPTQEAPTHAIPAPTTDNPPNPQPPDAHITASLGTAWAHAVHCRLVLEYAGSTRCVHIVKAPDCALATFDYVVNARGIEVVRQAALPMLEGGSVLGMAIGNTGQYGGGSGGF